jgi:hypothetical protein
MLTVKFEDRVDALSSEDSRENAPDVHNSYCSLKESSGESSATSVESDEIGRSCRNSLLGVQTSTILRPTALRSPTRTCPLSSLSDILVYRYVD